MNKQLGPYLRDSKIPREHFQEIDIIFKRMLKENYSKEVIMERLLHKATFDIDVFMRYFDKVSRQSDMPWCIHASLEDADNIGFDTNHPFGKIALGLINNLFNNKQELLEKYMLHVLNEEGCSFVGTSHTGAVKFSEWEKSILEGIEKNVNKLYQES